MSDGDSGVKIVIMDKEYLVACPAEEQDALMASAQYLSEKMSDIRRGGKVVGTDRIAVMAGLNIAHEAIASDGAGKGAGKIVTSRVKKLGTRIDKALAKYRKELN